ncbi:MAG: hypothetical protein WAV41_00770 [Microgenomates group bacterium]
MAIISKQRREYERRQYYGQEIKRIMNESNVALTADDILARIPGMGLAQGNLTALSALDEVVEYGTGPIKKLVKRSEDEDGRAGRFMYIHEKHIARMEALNQIGPAYEFPRKDTLETMARLKDAQGSRNRFWLKGIESDRGKLYWVDIDQRNAADEAMKG